MQQAELLTEQLRGTREWTLMLIADLQGDDWNFQPKPGLAHALWMCGHLASAQNTLIHTRCLGTPVLDDSFTDHFPLGSPVKSVQEHDYPSLESVLATMEEVQEKTCQAIMGMTDAMLAEPAYGRDGVTHPHYRDKRGVVTHCNRHEAFHAGQIATIRRLVGKPFLR